MIIPKKLNLVGRVFLSGLALFGCGKVTNAGGLFLKTSSILPTSRLYLKHITGATEWFDPGKDDEILFGPEPAVDLYSIINDSNYPTKDKLMRDSREPNSVTTFYSDVVGRGLSGAVDANIIPEIWYPEGEDNFDWKNLIGELYNSGDVNNPSNLISIHDFKYMDENSQTIPITVNNGLSHQLLVKPYNHADLNRDGRGNFLDFAIFANNFGRTGIDKGSNPADVNDYADITGNGIVDNNDLREFSYEWLWDANDPTTW